ncbi:hypothetical protein K458DRAFT_429923 [Lentithecium fluviatile CBS 122367]|uniref:Secreted protein n=1 Tax=Lentithecium fluviatile CBS 122367 TaxID=1168545 RepID=A0A6G1J628_9PLEO|nr:hypothetical protein K458DRAFT_429923 [Lentithecium fluviatile CBS 122367]
MAVAMLVRVLFVSMAEQCVLGEGVTGRHCNGGGMANSSAGSDRQRPKTGHRKEAGGSGRVEAWSACGAQQWGTETENVTHRRPTAAQTAVGDLKREYQILD